MSFHHTIATRKPVQEVLLELPERLKEVKFGVLWQLDIPAKLKEKGVEGYDTAYHVLEVCNPHIALHVLSVDASAGNFLPCKITVYEKDGSTYLSMPKPTTLMGMTENEKLIGIAQDVEATLMQVFETMN